MGIYFNITSILLAIIIIAYNFRLNKSSLYLGICLFFLNLNVIISHLIIGQHSIFWTVVLFKNFTPTSFLAPPFLYFFVRGALSGKDRIRLRDAWLFLPFFISILDSFPFWITPFSYKLKIAQSIYQNSTLIHSLAINSLYPFAFNAFLRMLLFFTCMTMCFYTIWRFNPSGKQSQRIGQLKFIRSYRWLVFLILFLFALSISQYFGFHYFLNSNSSIQMLEKVKNIWFINDVGFLIISLWVLFFPQLLYGPEGSLSGKAKQFSRAEIEKFYHIFYEKRFFLNPAANVEGLASELNFNKEDIIFFILKQEELNFQDFLQKSRVDYLVELLKIKDNLAFTFDALAEMACLGTRQSMYLAFKKFKNCSPTEFIHSINS